MREKSARIGSPISRLPRLSPWFPTMEPGLRLSMQINPPKLEVFLFVFFFPFERVDLYLALRILCSVAVSREGGTPLTGLDEYMPSTAHGFEGLESEKVITVYLAS